MILLIVGMGGMTLLVSYFFDILDLYAYIMAVVLFVIGIAFGFIGEGLIFLILFSCALILTAILVFYQFIKKH
jgi:hypothetical protein